ncbi:hypothetical protein MLD38_003880 [Melastoma candidum]|uniref:Uncharacterized protein n=1 Tax=Melastoma candidum TaxID=119954 RepID=A0ACB9S5A1_9MYRT|nr:hypothetical protein MLD38_003880 [Melastoma candidum]
MTQLLMTDHLTARIKTWTWFELVRYARKVKGCGSQKTCGQSEVLASENVVSEYHEVEMNRGGSRTKLFMAMTRFVESSLSTELSVARPRCRNPLCKWTGGGWLSERKPASASPEFLLCFVMKAKGIVKSQP